MKYSISKIRQIANKYKFNSSQKYKKLNKSNYPKLFFQQIRKINNKIKQFPQKIIRNMKTRFILANLKKYVK